jgi:hypothetical protein
MMKEPLMNVDWGLVIEISGSAAIALAFTFFAWRARTKATNAGAVLLGIAMMFGVLCGILAGTSSDRGSRWRWLASAVPALILVTHAAFLHYVRGRVVPVASATNQQMSVRILGDSAAARSAYQATVSAGQRYFSVEALLLRYVVPAVLVFFVILAYSNQLVKSSALDGYYNNCNTAATAPPMCALLKEAVVGEHAYAKPGDVAYFNPSIVLGAACGLVGAYVYVLLYLGRRAFRLDITPGAATWCVVTLAVGPMFAGFLGPYVLTNKPWANAGQLDHVAILFFAGFSPRLVVTFLNELVTRLFSDAGAARALPSRTIPLSQVRGITRDIEERLSEEGIDDASQLAMADPYRLLRNTSFDKRQILRWIDAALLIVNLPEAAPPLERRGVIGAMSLAWYSRDPSREVDLESLATDARLDVASLRGVARRLCSDQQVQLVQLLYELDSESGDPPLVQPT